MVLYLVAGFTEHGTTPPSFDMLALKHPVYVTRDLLKHTMVNLKPESDMVVFVADADDMHTKPTAVGLFLGHALMAEVPVVFVDPRHGSWVKPGRKSVVHPLLSNVVGVAAMETCKLIIVKIPAVASTIISSGILNYQSAPPSALDFDALKARYHTAGMSIPISWEDRMSRDVPHSSASIKAYLTGKWQTVGSGDMDSAFDTMEVKGISCFRWDTPTHTVHNALDQVEAQRRFFQEACNYFVMSAVDSAYEAGPSTSMLYLGHAIAKGIHIAFVDNMKDERRHPMVNNCIGVDVPIHLVSSIEGVVYPEFLEAIRAEERTRT